MHLDSLPGEVQCQIIRHLDPIGLISLSQTSSEFRHLINPQKRHFAERLLAFELIPEYGGPTLIFRSQDHSLQPKWPGKEWDVMRWACTDCLRLLPHKDFDNHSLLRLGYRKPLPGSPAANMITSWEPILRTRPRDRNTKRARRDAEDAAEAEKKRREAYFLSVTNGSGHAHATPVRDKFQTFGDCGMEVFREMNFLQFLELEEDTILEMLSQNAILIEGEECGKKRWLRKCNECRFRKGLIYHELDLTSGTRKFPIVPSRQFEFATHLDRLFPGFSDSLEHNRPPFNICLDLIYRDQACEQLWTMWMGRCPRCERWQELRAFRIWGLYQHWKPERMTVATHDPRHIDEGQWISEELLDRSVCNSCFAEVKSREELARDLQQLLSTFMRWELRRLSKQLAGGFHTLSYRSGFRLSKQNSKEWKNLLKQTPCLNKDYLYICTHNDVALLRLRRGQCLELWKVANEGFQEWYDGWVRDMEDIEEHWSWIMGCKDEIEENPDVLADWALKRDGAAFTRI
ncbi:hypothetical protein ACHAP7_001937 [Fusarium lateritium]